MKVYAYHYDQDFVFVGYAECQISPLEEGVFLIPAQSTPVEPPKAEGVMVAVYHPTGWVEKNGSHYIDGTWKLVCDYRSRLFWDKTTKETKRVTALGQEPDANWVDVKPGQFDVWNPGTKKWEYSAELELEAKKKQILYLNQVKFDMLKDIEFAKQHNMPLIVAERQESLSQVENKIRELENLK